jgi:hypothetical protein
LLWPYCRSAEPFHKPTSGRNVAVLQSLPGPRYYSTLAVSGGANDGKLTANNTILDCSKTYILDKKIYVDSGKVLTIQPGTLIKGRTYSTNDSATALTVMRYAKIFASGTSSCPIVFTAEADPMDGTYSISNKGKWGGVCIAGRATNNLLLSNNGPFQAGVGDGKIAVANGLGTFEGFASSNSKDQFGANLTAGESFDDDDNSGIFKYVSIRFAGAILQVGGELNALSLGSVGRGTTIDHVEVVSCADDGIELWGGTVNLKYCVSLFGNDDMFDFDDGWSGKAQFLFGLKTSTNDTLTSVDADNGFECDADDQKSNNTPRSHPVIYNCTIIGNEKKVRTSDNAGIAAIMAKEITEGEFYNNVFTNFRYGMNIVKATGTRTGGFEAYHNWANTGGNGTNSLKVKCNTFVGVPFALRIDANTGAPSAGTITSSDTAQFFTTDQNVSVSSVTGMTNVWAMNASTNAVTTQADAIPNPALSVTGCPTPPTDGFYSAAPYRGAFAPTGKNWLSEFAQTQILSVVNGSQPCPTDLNSDGVTNNVDFLQLLGKFNQSCQ